MATAKVLVVGPKDSGKTRLANYIAEFETQPALDEYAPTAGARILEFDRDVAQPGKRGLSQLAVELWDCSGDQCYESCWPAILSGATGCILVFEASKSQEGMRWFSAYVKKLGLSSAQVLVVVHHKEGGVPEQTQPLRASCGLAAWPGARPLRARVPFLTPFLPLLSLH